MEPNVDMPVRLFYLYDTLVLGVALIVGLITLFLRLKQHVFLPTKGERHDHRLWVHLLKEPLYSALVAVSVYALGSIVRLLIGWISHLLYLVVSR